mgnify:CR=1 FL=1
MGVPEDRDPSAVVLEICRLVQGRGGRALLVGGSVRDRLLVEAEGGHGRWRFAHALIRRVLADELQPSIRSAWHARIAAVFGQARTLVWNGPLGAFEIPPFNAATDAAARQAASLTRAGRLLSVAGGGDTVAALNAAGVTDRLTYVSTAGGAFLEWLEGRELPGVAALARATRRPSH